MSLTLKLYMIFLRQCKINLFISYNYYIHTTITLLSPTPIYCFPGIQKKKKKKSGNNNNLYSVSIWAKIIKNFSTKNKSNSVGMLLLLLLLLFIFTQI